MRREKDAIAEMAVELVGPGMAVMLDDSTTTLTVTALHDLDHHKVACDVAPCLAERTPDQGS